MSSESKSTTGFRNGDLFCFNCGRSYKMNLPQPVTMAAALMKQFSKDHENCQPAWKEPVNSDAESKSEVENAKWWAANGEHGMSSKTMFNHLSLTLHGFPLLETDYLCAPSDPDDFSRCYKLLQAVPQWKARLAELKALSPVWEKLVNNWEKLTAMYEQNVKEDWKNHKKIGMYEFMQTLGC